MMNQLNDVVSDAAKSQYSMGIVGNCQFSALIDKNAYVKWLCWPRFDSSFVFGSLLDSQNGGEFSITTTDKTVKSSQSYIENTNILVTRFQTDQGVFEVIDFAPRFLLNERYHKPLMLFRKVKKISGSCQIRVCCEPKGSYGTIVPETQTGSNHIRYGGLEASLRLTTNAPLTYIQQKKSFTLSEDLYFVLSWGIPLEGPLISTFDDFYRRTKKYWETWVEHCHLPRIYQKEVIRSALTLKLHQFEDTGGIIAAATTSLPEIDGQGRNWDYRYCWLRDTYYTIAALNSLGQFEEMEKYAHFVENIGLYSPDFLQPVYRVDGGTDLTESSLPLEGFRKNQPVRLGNEAALQIQHDAYGQILLALFNLYSDARLSQRHRLSVEAIESLLKFIERTLEEPDNGVWEFRGHKAIHSYSLLFHWAGASACRKIGLILGNASLTQRAEECVRRSSELIEKCYRPGKKAYSQALDSDELDASLLQMISLGYFYDKPHQRAVDHLRAIQKELEISPGYLLRYKHTDDFGKQESAFLVCSFWYIEALIHLGFVEEADELFQKVLLSQNHLGLISEDFDPAQGMQWGNFPQTYSHVGLINCAFAFDKAIRKPLFL